MYIHTSFRCLVVFVTLINNARSPVSLRAVIKNAVLRTGCSYTWEFLHLNGLKMQNLIYNNPMHKLISYLDQNYHITVLTACAWSPYLPRRCTLILGPEPAPGHPFKTIPLLQTYELGDLIMTWLSNIYRLGFALSTASLNIHPFRSMHFVMQLWHLLGWKISKNLSLPFQSIFIFVLSAKYCPNVWPFRLTYKDKN